MHRLPDRLDVRMLRRTFSRGRQGRARYVWRTVSTPILIDTAMSGSHRPDPAHPERLFVGHRARPSLTAAAMHGALRAFVLDPRYPCVGAKSAFNNGSYRLGIYERLAKPAATAALARDLAAFTREIDEIGAFATFVAMFERPRELDDVGFEQALWAQLQALHDIDAAAWDPGVSADPDDPRFSFSFAGVGLFVVGMHPGSDRLSRRFAWPTMIFNPHAQFERLRETGKYARMQAVIRDRDQTLQGCPNAALADFGSTSEARQYSGRAAPPDWRPPFRARASTRS